MKSAVLALAPRAPRRTSRPRPRSRAPRSPPPRTRSSRSPRRTPTSSARPSASGTRSALWTRTSGASATRAPSATSATPRSSTAAFLGYLAGSTELVSGPHKILPYRGYEPGLTPPEQWDAIPHYTKGGLPGSYPPIKGKRPELIFNLYDPFNFFEQ